MSYKKKVFKIIPLRFLKSCLKELRKYDKYESLSSHHYKIFYLYHIKTNLDLTKYYNVLVLMHLSYSLIGNHTEYFYYTKYNELFVKMSLQYINTYNPVLDVYKSVTN